MKAARYFVALMWHWSIPFLMGFAVSMVVSTWQVLELSDQFETAFKAAISEHCGLAE